MSIETHDCGGTILSGYGPNHSYCDRCGAFAVGDDPVPDGTDRDANRRAWDNCEERSPAREPEPEDTPEGWIVFHAKEAGKPHLHGVEAGEPGNWHYEPEEGSGDVWSKGYPTRREALEALLAELEGEQ